MKLKIRSMAAADDCDLPVWRLRRKKSFRRNGPRGGEGSGHATVQRLGQRQGFAQAERRQTKKPPSKRPTEKSSRPRHPLQRQFRNAEIAHSCYPELSEVSRRFRHLRRRDSSASPRNDSYATASHEVSRRPEPTFSARFMLSK